MEASAVPRLAPAGVSVIKSPHVLRLASDAHLVALIREGRGAAFEAVYDRHHRGILSFCRHMLGDAQEAEDALQHTFLSAYNDLITSKKQIHLRAWLFAIARNRCYSILRSRREQPSAELDEAVTEGLATQVQRRQDLRDLVVDMRSLPEDQRAALVLAELESLSHEQIGEALGVPREKVKALVFQARESLVASRTARETDCGEIREQLATGRGGTLRRANLRRHLRDCAGCREFRKQVEHQRHQLAILLPVVPTLALRDGVLAAAAGSSGAAGIAGGGLVLSSALKSGALKAIVGTVIAGVGTAGTIVATHGLQLPFASSSSPPPTITQAPAPAARGRRERALELHHDARILGSSCSSQHSLSFDPGNAKADRASCPPVPSPRNTDPNVWPANLPSGARWLPYSPEPRPQPPASLPYMTSAPAPPIAAAAPRRRIPANFWQLLVAAVVGAGLIGIGGGMAAAAIFGAR